MSVRLSEVAFDPTEELRAFTAEAEGAGAVVSFTGLVRPSRDNAAVTGLLLDHHPRLTLRSMETIAAGARARFPISAVHIVHRCGWVGAHEPIVFAAAAAAHRRAAFEAADYVMDRLKSDAMFWKREERVDGADWIEPTTQDGRDLARWR